MKVIFTSRSIRPTDVSWPCHALLGSTKCLRKFIKSVGSLPSAYSKEKELSDKYLRKKGAALPRPSGWIDIMSKSFKNIYCKNNYEKIFICFLVIIFWILKIF